MSKKQKPFFYREKTKKWLWRILWAACIIPLIFENGLHRHSHFAESGIQSIDGIFGFYAILGFVGCASMILIAKFLGLGLKKKGNYYDQ